MTLSSRHRIRNSNPGGLRPSTLPLGHGGSPQYWLSHVDEEETFFVSFKPPEPGTEPRTLAWKAVVLTTTLGPPPSAISAACHCRAVPSQLLVIAELYHHSYLSLQSCAITATCHCRAVPSQLLVIVEQCYFSCLSLQKSAITATCHCREVPSQLLVIAEQCCAVVSDEPDWKLVAINKRSSWGVIFPRSFGNFWRCWPSVGCFFCFRKNVMTRGLIKLLEDDLSSLKHRANGSTRQPPLPRHRIRV